MKQISLVLLVLSCYLCAPAAEPPTPPPAPLETATATDLPLHYNGATGQLAEWLKLYEIQPQKFSYTVQLLREDDQVRLYRLTYPSPFASPWPENNIVPCELSLPKHPKGKMPAVVVLDILDGKAIFPRLMSRTFAEQGLAALYMPMPCYNDRRPKNKAHEQALKENPLRVADAVRQAVMDVRRAKAILASRPDVDPHQLGLTGISLGGITAALAAGVDGEFDRVAPILSGGDLAAIAFHARETKPLREMLEQKGYTREKAGDALAFIEPLNFAARIKPKTCFMVNAANDEVIPKESTLALHKAIGQPEIYWTQLGHYSSALYLPYILQKTADFLSGKGTDGLAQAPAPATQDR